MWYAVDVLMKSCSSELNDALWEECIYLLEANSELEAEYQAQKEAVAAGEVEYVAESGEAIKWEFDSVLSIYEILSDKIVSGTELFSRFLRKEEADSLKTPWKNE
jgi:hypothetical protein